MFCHFFEGAMFTQKTSIEPSNKIQNMILQQSNIFLSGFIDSQPMSALSYLMIILLCLLYTSLLLAQNTDFTIRSSDLLHCLYLLAMIC